MVRKLVIAVTAALLVVAMVSDASSRVRHRHGHGWGFYHGAYGSGSYRGNPTNTNGF